MKSTRASRESFCKAFSLPPILIPMMPKGCNDLMMYAFGLAKPLEREDFMWLKEEGKYRHEWSQVFHSMATANPKSFRFNLFPPPPPRLSYLKICSQMSQKLYSSMANPDSFISQRHFAHLVSQQSYPFNDISDPYIKKTTSAFQLLKYCEEKYKRNIKREKFFSRVRVKKESYNNVENLIRKRPFINWVDNKLCKKKTNSCKFREKSSLIATISFSKDNDYVRDIENLKKKSCMTSQMDDKHNDFLFAHR
jgi:hypothetical protein